MNLQELKALYEEIIKNREGTLGAASYQEVYRQLMPVQQENLLKYGLGKSIIVLGLFHSDKAVKSINTRKNGKIDKEAWNIYAGEYHELNRILNHAARIIAEHVKGVPIPATLEGFATRINRVEDYYSAAVSQRVLAECAGLGWRGKCELIVTEKKGCALRLASVICPLKLPPGQKVENKCGQCMACLEVCPFLRKKHTLKNYREQCRRFIVTLRLDADVCGKCVRACYEHWTEQLKCASS